MFRGKESSRSANPDLSGLVEKEELYKEAAFSYLGTALPPR